MLPKIDELTHIAKLTNAAVIGTSESKLDNSVFTSEIQINEYELVCCNIISDFRKDIGNIFFEILPNSEPLVVGTIYRPPS